ncbi:required for respiratory growth protein 9, mitochondrial [Aspergillus cavernicola]|uniref:Required for respiratory growth protein 9, mitochondrial n=1 Tax=Aspergillus cavernicola TaxID=176166 RepID=A0ABR4IZ65_9EURO
MASICPTSANISLPTILRTLFYPELTPQLRTLATRTLNRPSFPRHSFRKLSTAPGTFSSQTQLPETLQNEPSTNIDSSSTSKPDGNDNVSTKAKTSTAKPPSSRRTDKMQTKPFNAQKTNDRNAKKDKPMQKDRPSFNPGPKKKREEWQIQKEALKKKFPAGWSPNKKLSPDALEGIRHLHSMAPDRFTTSVLAEEFKVSPEAIRRILKSKWRASETELEDRRQRWEKRHDRIWSHLSELGLRPHTDRTGHLSDAVALLYDQKKKDDQNKEDKE